MRACNAEGQLEHFLGTTPTGKSMPRPHAVNGDFCQFAGRVRTGFDSHNKCNAWGDCHTFARNFDVEFSATMLKMAGIDVDLAPGGHLVADS